jgi:hypothetical protein
VAAAVVAVAVAVAVANLFLLLFLLLLLHHLCVVVEGIGLVLHGLNTKRQGKIFSFQ